MTAAPTATATTPSWQSEPTDDQCIAKLRAARVIPTPESIEHARKELSARLSEDLRRLQTADPAALEAVITARAEADEAAERADRILADAQAKTRALCGMVSKYGILHFRIQQMKELAGCSESVEALGKEALRRYWAQVQSPCGAHAAEFRAAVEKLVWRNALAPHVKAEVDVMEANVVSLKRRILEECERERIDLKSIVSLVGQDFDASPGNYPDGYGACNWHLSLLPDFFQNNSTTP